MFYYIILYYIILYIIILKHLKPESAPRRHPSGSSTSPVHRLPSVAKGVRRSLLSFLESCRNHKNGTSNTNSRFGARNSGLRLALPYFSGYGVFRVANYHISLFTPRQAAWEASK